jgi:hypothetical protein
MPNPLGINGTTGRGRPLADALRRELLANDKAKLKQLVKTTLHLALAGEAWAQQLIYERIDGRVPQPVGGSEELGPQRLQIEWKLSPANELAVPAPQAQLPAPSGIHAVERKPSAQVLELPLKSQH